jgi:hypothetical protein
MAGGGFVKMGILNVICAGAIAVAAAASFSESALAQENARTSALSTTAVEGDGQALGVTSPRDVASGQATGVVKPRDPSNFTVEIAGHGVTSPQQADGGVDPTAPGHFLGSAQEGTGIRMQAPDPPKPSNVAGVISDGQTEADADADVSNNNRRERIRNAARTRGGRN